MGRGAESAGAGQVTVQEWKPVRLNVSGGV